MFRHRSIPPLVRRPWHRLPRHASTLLAFLLLIGLAWTSPPAAAQPGADPPAPGTTAQTYRLDDVWQDVVYSGAPALFGAPLDIAAAPDGRIFVLDRRAVRPDPADRDRPAGGVVHVLAADGAPLAEVPIGDGTVRVERLDAAPDGGFVVLARIRNGNNAAVWRYDAAGTRTRELAVDDSAVDVAVAPDGRIVVADVRRLRIHGEPGRPMTIIDPIAGPPTPSSPPGAVWSATLLNVDVAGDGRIYVHLRAEARAEVTPDRAPTPTHTPTPTPRPRLAGSRTETDHDASSRKPRPAAAAGVTAMIVVETKEQVIVIRPDGRSERVLHSANWILDVAAGASEGYITLVQQTYRPVYAVSTLGRGATPIGLLPIHRSLGPGDYASVDAAMPVRLGVTPGGAILAAWPGTDHFYRGAVNLGLPSSPSADRPRALALGVHGVPLPYGPRRPAAVSVAGERVVVYEAPYSAYGDESGVRAAVDARGAVGAMQHFAADGRLIDTWAHYGTQAHVRGQVNWSQYGVPVDIAGTDEAVYAITPGALWRRTDGLGPDWAHRVLDGQFIAVDADAGGGLVAVVDAADTSVRLFTTGGEARGHWPINGAGRPPCAPADIAIVGERVFLADQGRNRIIVRDLDGTPQGEFATHDGPLRIDATAGGDIVVLGRGGWGLRYGAAGALVAAWRLPGVGAVKPAVGNDIAAAGDDRVYVTWVGASRPADADRRGDRIERAGVWVFVPAVAEELPSEPDVRACLVNVDKQAAPPAVRLGEAIEVRLIVNADCPKEPLPQQIMIVLDTSWSMNDGYLSWREPPGALDRARSVLLPLLASLSPEVVDVGLVTFSDGAALETVLSDDIAAMRSRIVRAVADGDTRMGAGIDLARRELLGPRRTPDARPSILIVSDGVFKDDPEPAITAARAAGIDVYALVMSTPEFTNDYRVALLDLLGDAEHLFVDPSADTARDLIEAISVYREETRLFETLTVRDVVPANMRYVVGSAVPAADWDPATRTLTWVLGEQPAGAPVVLTFRAVPLAVGHHPTNVAADARWRDARGGSGERSFPVPEVDVGPGRLYLPLAIRTQCTTSSRPLDVVLVHDVSSSMALPSADGVRTKLAVAVEAAGLFVARLDAARDRVAVVAFDAEARVAAPLTGDVAAASRALATLRPGVGTRIDRGLERAVALLAGDARRPALPVVVLLSDGLQVGPTDTVRAAATELRTLGARVFVIGFGEAHDEALLRAIAGDPSDYRFAPTVEDLRAVYEGVGRTLSCP